MASLKLTLFVMVALAYVVTSQCYVVKNFEEGTDITTEKKGVFDFFKEKAGVVFNAAIDTGKLAYTATKGVVSDGVEVVREKIHKITGKEPEESE